VEEEGIEESYFFLDEALKCRKAFSLMISFMEKKIFLNSSFFSCNKIFFSISFSDVEIKIYQNINFFLV